MIVAMMRMKRLILATVLVVFGFVSVNAQSVFDLRINEVMLFNRTSYIDSYGERSAWIEIVNTGYNSVNVAGCFLTNDISNPMKYRIPSADPIALIPQQQYLVFFANGKSVHGTLHLNFTLDSANRFIALFAPDGRTLIDSTTLPIMDADKSFVRMPNGKGEWQISELATPNSTNELFAGHVTAGEKFVKFDPYGFIMALTAMTVVFTALLVLYRLFKLTARVAQKPIRIQFRKSKQAKVDVVEKKMEEIPGEVFAAISAALYFYETEKHDQESTVLTIERVSRRYSPWSSKLYSLQQTPNRIVVHRKLN
ncbi:MAG TPA: lamin tail domain-containing protein [Bacteroidales bacterium]|nr:lamin tail domain-containing protein [Bacteroidales bacterium]